MSGEIKTFFFGKECRNCEALGVRCSQVGILTSGVPAKIGETAIYLNDIAVLRSGETIDECPAITGQSTNEKVAAKIKQNAEIAKDMVSIDM